MTWNTVPPPPRRQHSPAPPSGGAPPEQPPLSPRGLLSEIIGRLDATVEMLDEPNLRGHVRRQLNTIVAEARRSMRQDTADLELARMRAVMATLRQVDADARRPDPLGDALNRGDGTYRP